MICRKKSQGFMKTKKIMTLLHLVNSTTYKDIILFLSMVFKKQTKKKNC